MTSRRKPSVSTPPRTSGSKRCAGACQRDLPVIAFAGDPEAEDGLRDRCRDCDREVKRGGGKRPFLNVGWGMDGTS